MSQESVEYTIVNPEHQAMLVRRDSLGSVASVGLVSILERKPYSALFLRDFLLEHETHHPGYLNGEGLLDDKGLLESIVLDIANSPKELKDILETVTAWLATISCFEISEFSIYYGKTIAHTRRGSDGVWEQVK